MSPAALKTGRIMVKDEDLCLHCGLCAERCPTGAWDMQKFLSRNAPRPEHAMPTRIESRQRLRRQIRQRQRLGLGVAPTSCSRARSCAWACRSPRATSSRRTSRACRPGTRCASRASGHRGRRGGVDLMVAMNPQTWDQDVAEIDPGGYLFYDSTKPMPPIEVPRRHHRHRHAADRDLQTRATPTRASASFSRTSSISARSPSLLGIDAKAVETLIGEQFKGKDKLIPPNIEAPAHGPRPCAREPARSAASGHEAGRGRRPHLHRRQRRAGLGAVYGGATVAAWYPITPSTSLAEAFANHCRNLRVDPETGKNRFAIIQAEDELAAIGMVIGAAWNGARAFTATSGPGISLMQEFLGLAYFAEIPAVIFDVQRGGPSTGMPTRTQQSDILSAAYASHGDTKHVLLFPEDPRECFEFGADVLRSRRPAADADLRHARPRHRHERVAVRAARLGRQRQIRPRQGADRRGPRGRQGVRPLSRRRRRRHPLPHLSRHASEARAPSSPAAPRKDRYASYSEEGADYVDNMQRLLRKFETAKWLVPAPVQRRCQGADAVGVIYFGSTAPAMDEALADLEARASISTRLRIRAFPFADSVIDFVIEHDQVFVVEQNRDAQLRTLLVNECAHRSGAAHLDPALRRHADHRALHPQGNRRPPHRAQCHARCAGPCRMTYLLKPKLHHPKLPKNELGFTHRDYEGSVSTLCAGCGHDSISCGDHPGVLRARPAAASRRQAVGHRLLVEDADLFPRPEPRLQQRARPHAVGADRRQPRQPRPHLSGRFGRRRFRLDRAWPVRPLPPPRREHGLHRREQRRVRPDQGAVLGHRRQGLEEQEGRGEHRRADRSRVDGAAARRDLSSRAASPATRISSCRSSRRRSSTAAPPSST